jgi:predicted transcriptional regulators
MTADESSLVATVQGQLQDAMNFEGSSEEKKIRAYLATIGLVLAPGAHSQFGSGKNTQFEPEQRANPFENVFSKTAVFPPPAIAETDL